MIRYEAQLEKDWRYIIQDSDTKLILAANDQIREKCLEYVGNVRHGEILLMSKSLLK
jgi:long-subunit acyl-CoA synthetase (AMP-forming)